MYSPDKPYKVYNQKYRWSDAWDAMDYGFVFDENKTFHEQYSDLMLHVPKQNLANTNIVNAEYGNNNKDLEDCYMCFSTGDAKDCFHLNDAARDNECVDGYWVLHSTKAYEVIEGDNITASRYISQSKNISNASYLIGCENCHHCHMCI
jgi:hypothetical protein